MKSFFTLGLFITIVIISCKEKKKSENNQTDSKTVVAQDRVKDSAEISGTIMSFYNWYNVNDEKLQKFRLYKGDRPPYKMNWSEVDRLHQFMRDSVPQLSEAFIKNQNSFLQQSDSAFKVDFEDEIPFGFDWDWYTNSQEDPQYILDEINKSKNWIYNVKDDHATVEIKGSNNDNGNQTTSTIIKLDMIREGGKWKIARIGE